MGLTAFTDTHNSSVGSEIFHGSYTAVGDFGDCAMGGSCCGNCYVTFRWFYGSLSLGFNETTRQSALGECSNAGNFSDSVSVDVDRVIEFRARAVNDYCSGSPSNGSIQSFKTYANGPSMGTPTASSITDTTATLSGTFNAAVVESTFSVGMFYRRFGTSTWVAAGSVSTGSSIAIAVTGLTPNTIYEIQMVGTRNTVNSTSWSSSISSFSTIDTSPTIVTNPCPFTNHLFALASATVDPNGQSVRVRFGWGLFDGGSTPGGWTTLTGYQSFTGTTPQNLTADLESLSANTTYFYRAFVEWPSPAFNNSASGVTVSFITSNTPGAGATEETHMHLPQWDASYGVAYDVFFCLSVPSGSNSDRLVTTDPATLFATGDIKLSKDGGALANYTVANIVQVTASQPLYKMPLVAADLQAEILAITIRDQDGPAFRDLYIIVRTKQRLGQINVDATQIGSSAAAINLKSATGGYAIAMFNGASALGKATGILENMVLRTGTAQGGGASTITLDSSAVSTNDYYNEDIVMIVSGTGVGQSRIISDYDGTTKVASVNSSWAVNPDSTSIFVIMPGPRTLGQTIAELTAIPSAGDTLAKKIQFMFQRFAFKVTQTATLQTLYTSAGVSLGTRAVSDDGTTQQIEKVT